MKKLVSLRFSRFAPVYESKIIIQKQTALELAKISLDINGTGIDLGCGTGLLTKLIKKDIIGIDISENMINIYKKINPNCIVADIEYLPFKDNSFDFAISNFSLHWTNIEKSFLEGSRVLKPEGKFIFCMPVKGSLSIIKEILGYETFDFKSPEIIINNLKDRFYLQKKYVKNYEIKFKTPLQLLKHLKNTGTTISNNKESFGKKLQNYKKFLDFKGEPVLNFNVLFIKGIKINTI